MNDTLDKKGGTVENKKIVQKEIENIVLYINIHDVWRIRNPTDKRFTKRQKKPLVQCHLDFWLISDELYDFVKDT